MKFFLFFIFCLGGFSIVNAQAYSLNTKTAIGKTFKKIDEIKVFKNFKEEDGILISNSKEKNDLFLKISDGVTTMVLYAKYSPNGNKILGILDPGRTEKNMRIIMRECRVNANIDGFVVALVNIKPWKAYFSNVIKAWRVDQKTNTFISVPTKGIECLNEEFENID